jgi:hypothetical protein
MILQLANKIEFKISYLFFILYFFIQPIYKYYEWVRGFPRVNISIIVSIMFVVALGMYIVRIKEKKSSHELVALSLLMYITIIQLLSLPWASNYSINGVELYLKIIASTIFGYWMFWFTGINLENIVKSKYFFQFVFGVWIMISISIVLNALTNEHLFGVVLEGKSIYLMLADSYAVVSILLLSFMKTKIRFIILIISSIILFALFSRTSLYGFVFVIGILLFKNYKYLLISLISISIYLLLLNANDLASDRMFRVLLGGEDKSQTARQVILQKGLIDLKEDWLLGQFMGEVESHNGKPGKYIHSYLSFLRQFGFLPFILFLYIVIYNYYYLLIRWIKGKTTDTYLQFLFLFTTFVLFEIILSRSYIFPYIWLSIAAMPIYLNKTVSDNVN